MGEIEILEQYLKTTDLTIKELHDRNALSQIVQAMMAFRNESEIELTRTNEDTQ